MAPKITPQRLIEALEAAGYTVRSYSGRGMGKTRCVAISVGVPADLFRMGVSLAEEFVADELNESASGLRPSTDSLGLGTVIYFPAMEWPAARESTDDE